MFRFESGKALLAISEGEEAAAAGTVFAVIMENEDASCVVLVPQEELVLQLTKALDYVRTF